jgi:hypothetical protein
MPRAANCASPIKSSAAARSILSSPGFVSNIELFREMPEWAQFLMRLAAFSQIILFDKRGTGL